MRNNLLLLAVVAVVIAGCGAFAQSAGDVCVLYCTSLPVAKAAQ